MPDRFPPAVGVGVARLDARGCCSYANERLGKILGVAPEEILGDGWRRLSPDFDSRTPERWDELRAGRAVASLETHDRADGRRVSVVIESMPELDADGRVTSVLVTCIDVTAQEGLIAESDHHRERAAARLAELEDLYHHTPVALCALDLELRYVRTNRRYAEIVGYDPDDLIGRRMWDVIPVSAREEAVGIARQAMETGEPVIERELRRIRPGQTEPERIWLASVHPIRRNGQVTGSMGLMQDVTQARRAEQAARARLAELESIYANSPVGLSLIDRELRYVKVNQAIAEMNGMPPEQIVGKAYRELAPDTADLAERFLRLVAERGQSVRNLEVRARPPGDPEHEHVYLLSLDPMRDAQGEVTGLMSAVQDVTELRRAEQVAARRLEELELVYANAPVGLCHADPELRVQHLNARFAALGGRPVPELVGRTIPELLPSSLARQLVPHLQQVVHTGMASIGSQLRGRPPGPGGRDYTWIVNIHPARRDGALAGVIIVLQDVTALADRQREVEAIRDRLEEAQHVAKVGSWAWDILTDEVWWSPALYEIFGLPRSHVPTYTDFFERVHRWDRHRLREQIDQTLRDDEPYRLRLRIVRSDGAERDLFTAARLERTPDGQPARLVGTCQDITDFGPEEAPAARRGRRSTTRRRRGDRRER